MLCAVHQTQFPVLSHAPAQGREDVGDAGMVGVCVDGGRTWIGDVMWLSSYILF